MGVGELQKHSIGPTFVLRFQRLLAKVQVKLDANAVKLGALWAKCLSSFIKMKVRKGMSSIDSWNCWL